MGTFWLSGAYVKGTSQLREDQRMDYWREVICDEFVKLDCRRMPKNFRGELRGGARVGHLQLSEVIADPQFVERSRPQIARSQEEEFLISLQVSQRGLVCQNGREALLTPGTFALYDSTEPYSLTFEDPFHQIVLQLPKKLLAQYLTEPEGYTAIPFSNTSGLGAVLASSIFSLAREINDLPPNLHGGLSENLISLIAMALNASHNTRELGGHSIVRNYLKGQVHQYIDDHLNDPELSNRHIARALNISLRYLHSLFEDEPETVHALILHKRLRQARKLLLNPSSAARNVQQIAYLTGFASAAHFSRSFKKKFGVAPSEVRS